MHLIKKTLGIHLLLLRTHFIVYEKADLLKGWCIKIKS